ncbi:MAG: DUF6186 family protein [Acidimicrobiales bacterium]
MTVREVTIAIWVVLAAIAIGLEVLAHTTHRPVAPAGTVARLATRTVVGRIVVSVGWMWLGWHVFAR